MASAVKLVHSLLVFSGLNMPIVASYGKVVVTSLKKPASPAKLALSQIPSLP
jgi:hypothetical protein